MSPPSQPAPRRRPWPRRIERAILGAMMGVIAFVIERRVLKSIRKGGSKAEPAKQPLEGGLGRDGLAVSPKQIDQ